MSFRLDKEFVQATAELCKEKDILLLIDEVQTGIGRTGSLFCYEQYGVQPNIISMAKGLGGGVPIGAVMADKKCQDVLAPVRTVQPSAQSALLCGCQYRIRYRK